ncbi:MAG: hypothetical protein FJ224_01925 [Lentisphaerae bacterium]|nr:hypothetical protein [Lentisphaerota bacterium]
MTWHRSRGYNVNYPMGEKTDFRTYQQTLRKAIRRIETFGPTWLVVCLGLDTANGDPTGTWDFRAREFSAIGSDVGAMKLPTLVVQEGGYSSRSIGANAKGFFNGLLKGRGHKSIVDAANSGNGKPGGIV